MDVVGIAAVGVAVVDLGVRGRIVLLEGSWTPLTVRRGYFLRGAESSLKLFFRFRVG